MVSPYVHPQDASASVSYDDAARACTNQDPEYRIPNLEELASIYVNRNLFGLPDGDVFLWSSTLSPTDTSKAYNLNRTGTVLPEPRSWARNAVRCVKR